MLKLSDLKKIRSVPYENQGKIAFEDFSISNDDQYGRKRYGKPNKLDIAKAFADTDLYTLARENTEKNSRFKQQGINVQNRRDFLAQDEINRNIGLSQQDVDKRNIKEAQLNALERANRILEQISGEKRRPDTPFSEASQTPRRSDFGEFDMLNRDITQYVFNEVGEPSQPAIVPPLMIGRGIGGQVQEQSIGLADDEEYFPEEASSSNAKLPYDPSYEQLDPQALSDLEQLLINNVVSVRSNGSIVVNNRTKTKIPIPNSQKTKEDAEYLIGIQIRKLETQNNPRRRQIMSLIGRPPTSSSSFTRPVRPISEYDYGGDT